MKWQRTWPTAFDLIKLCAGSYAELGLHSDTIMAVCREFAARRNMIRRCPRWRSAKKSLGWIPFITRAVQLNGATVTYLKKGYRFWRSRDMSGEFKCGAFVQDARGRWYATFDCKMPDRLQTGTGEVGIDLGLKRLATLSDGTTIPALRHFRRYEGAIVKAQRARNKRRVRAIHAKIANLRRHHLHEWSAKIARENRLIVVGNVNAGAKAKTHLAKSVLDAAWSMFRNQLRYKASRHGARYVEADEYGTSATCSDCGAVSGPKGIAGLRMRHWDCPSCGCTHDRDVNAARNILRVGLERQAPAGEIPA